MKNAKRIKYDPNFTPVSSNSLKPVNSFAVASPFPVSTFPQLHLAHPVSKDYRYLKRLAFGCTSSFYTFISAQLKNHLLTRKFIQYLVDENILREEQLYSSDSVFLNNLEKGPFIRLLIILPKIGRKILQRPSYTIENLTHHHIVELILKYKQKFRWEFASSLSMDAVNDFKDESTVQAFFNGKYTPKLNVEKEPATPETSTPATSVSKTDTEKKPPQNNSFVMSFIANKQTSSPGYIHVGQKKETLPSNFTCRYNDPREVSFPKV